MCHLLSFPTFSSFIFQYFLSKTELVNHLIHDNSLTQNTFNANNKHFRHHANTKKTCI